MALITRSIPRLAKIPFHTKHMLFYFCILLLLLLGHYPMQSQAQQEKSMNVARVFVETNRQAAPVVIFSKSFCPFCKKAKEIFNSHGQAFKAFELDQLGLSENRIY